MNPGLPQFITRAGLACDLLAFFLATPELLGQKRLMALRDHLETILWWFSLGMFVVSFILLIPFFLIGPMLLVSSLPLPFSGSLSDKFLVLIILGPIISASISWLPKRIMIFVEKLSDSTRTRRLLLNCGIALFVLGVLAQFFGTF